MLVMFDVTEPGASARPGCRTAAAITAVRWHPAVAFAAGSDTCVRPDLLELPETAKLHCPLRDPTAKPPLGRREANGRVTAMLVRRQISFRGRFSYMS
jgi:hypothetical protein